MGTWLLAEEGADPSSNIIFPCGNSATGGIPKTPAKSMLCSGRGVANVTFTGAAAHCSLEYHLPQSLRFRTTLVGQHSHIQPGL
jgi:hypothetical protein